ncbi:MAG: fatty acid desaturase [Pseudomonadota bacterium]
MSHDAIVALGVFLLENNGKGPTAMADGAAHSIDAKANDRTQKSGNTIEGFAEMRATARALTPRISWPTFAMAIGVPLATASVIALALSGRIPLLAATPILGYIGYCHFIYVHEAFHHNIFPGHPRLVWLETLFGWIGSIVLITTYPQLKHAHLLHHANLNGPDDPDTSLARGSFKRLITFAILGIFINVFPPSIRDHLFGGENAKKYRAFLTDEQWRIHNRAGWAQSIFGLICILAGYGLEWFLLWMAAGRLGILILQILIVWAPHQPYDPTNQFTGTRLFFSPGVTLFMWWNNMHLIHHLFPGLPFYQYPAFYKKHRAHLMANGANIEGLIPGSPPSREVGGDAAFAG